MVGSWRGYLEGVAFGSLRELTLRLPRVQYSLMMQLLFHLSRDVDTLLSHLLDGIQLTFVQSNGREDGRVAEVGIRIGTQAHLAGADQRMGGLRRKTTRQVI